MGRLNAYTDTSTIVLYHEEFYPKPHKMKKKQPYSEDAQTNDIVENTCRTNTLSTGLFDEQFSE
jgi:hypothetical protein